MQIAQLRDSSLQIGARSGLGSKILSLGSAPSTEARTKIVKATTATPGEYSASRPLEVVQIDHTRADVFVVDEQTRTPIGRPWLTLASDVYSRIVPGFYLTMDAPS